VNFFCALNVKEILKMARYDSEEIVEHNAMGQLLIIAEIESERSER
jgi:hypothetical protein